MKPRTCPNCKQIVPIDHGFSFDEKLNMICDSCGKAIIATSWDKEPTLYTVQSAYPHSWSRTDTKGYIGGGVYGSPKPLQ